MVSLEEVRYFVFDVETAADGDLISRVRYPDEKLSPRQAVARFREERQEQYGTDFIPYTYQFPVAVVVGKVKEDFELAEIAVLDEPHYRSHEMTARFWKGWETYGRPTLVSFNGRTFDVPLMELAAFRYGVSAPTWFDLDARTYDQPRNRYNIRSHLDLHDLLTNFGAARFSGGLNLAAAILGKPGKMAVQGHMVQDLYEEGRISDINNYCCCDVLDTYFVFLRCAVMMGRLQLEQEQALVQKIQTWMKGEAKKKPAFEEYLQNWGDWDNPWRENENHS